VSQKKEKELNGVPKKSSAHKSHCDSSCIGIKPGGRSFHALTELFSPCPAKKIAPLN
jgi:hypothetical protein